MTTESIRVDVADDGGSTRKLVQSTDALAVSLNKAADAEQRAQTALAKTATSAREAAAATDQLSRSNAEAAASATLLQRAGSGASQAATSLTSASTALGTSSNAAARGLTSATAATQGLARQAQAAGTALAASGTGAASFARQANGMADGAKNAEAAMARLGIQQGFVNKAADQSRTAVGGASSALNSATSATTNWAGRLRSAVGAATDWASNVFTMSEAASKSVGSLGLFGSANDKAEASVRKLGHSSKDMAGEIKNSFGDTIQNVAQQVLMLAAAAGSVTLVALNDQFNMMSNRLITLAGSARAAKDVLAGLNNDVGNLGIPLDAASQAYAKFGANFRAVGLDTQAVTPLMQLLSMAILSTGTDAATAGTALVELSNAFKGGRTDAQAMEAVLTKYPALGAALMTAFNNGTVAIGNQTAANARLSASLDGAGGRIDQFAQKIVGSAGVIQQTYGQMIPTISLAWQSLVNNLTAYLGRAQETNAATNLVVGTLQYLSNNLTIVIGLFAALAAAVAVIGFAALIASIGIVTTAFVGLVTAANGFVGITALIIGSVTGGIAVLRSFAEWLAKSAEQFPLISSLAELTVRAIDALTEGIKAAWNWLVKFVKTLADLTGLSGAVSGAFDSINNSVKDYITGNNKGTINTNTLREVLKNLGIQTVNTNGSIAAIYDTTGQASTGFGTYAGAAGTATSATQSLNSATQQLDGTVRTVTDSMRGYGQALYGVSDAQNNLAAITGKTTAEIDAQKRAIAEASTYVDRYNNSVSAMTANLDSGWGGTKGNISVPSYSYPGAPQITIGSGFGASNALANVDLFNQKQKEWNAYLADLDSKGALQDGKINSNSDYVKSNPSVLNDVKKRAGSGSGLMNLDLSNFIVSGKASTDPTATASNSSASNLNMSSPVYQQPEPIYTQPVTTTPSTGGGTVDTGATAAELSGLAAAAHAAALALNSIYSALAGQGVTTFATDGIPGTGTATAQPGTGTGLTAPQPATVGTVPAGMGTGATPSASTALNDNTAPASTGVSSPASGLVLDIQAVGEAVDALNAKMPPSIDGRGGGQYSGMTYQQIADAMIRNGSKTEADLYKTTETVTNNKKIGTVNVFIGVKDSSQLGLNAKQKAQDMARELAKAV